MCAPSAPATLLTVLPSVLIVDDNESFLDAARVLLEREGVRVVGLASATDQALRLADRLSPDVVLVDIHLAGESGFELATRLASDGGAPTVLISTHAESDFADLIAASPALAFLPKSEISAEAIVAILARSAR
jgi:DNA-binding NarL/FixJ family response regulator